MFILHLLETTCTSCAWCLIHPPYKITERDVLKPYNSVYVGTKRKNKLLYSRVILKIYVITINQWLCHIMKEKNHAIRKKKKRIWSQRNATLQVWSRSDPLLVSQIFIVGRQRQAWENVLVVLPTWDRKITTIYQKYDLIRVIFPVTPPHRVVCTLSYRSGILR